MKQFDARSYSIADFLEWNGSGLLDLSPKFQRRSVWTRAAKSFLLDTILRGKPMPKVLLTQDLKDKRNVRTVVDGQQRIRAILDFAAGNFTVLRTHNEQHHGKTFQELDQEVQESLLQYEIGVDLLYNVGLSDMLDIFARINTYSVTLNRQEKLNAKYLGAFKTTSYELGHSYAGYFLEGAVLTEKQISRMGEAQFASDMLVAVIGGVQTVKNIERYYKKYESADEPSAEVVSGKDHVVKAMSFIGAIYKPEELKNSNWARPHWFYTLFTSVAHAFSPLEGLENARRPSLTNENVYKWRSALDELSAKYDEYTGEPSSNVPPSFLKFINYAQRRTTDTDARRARAVFVLEHIDA